MDAPMKTVTYDAPNIMKCRCTTCPVQGESACANEMKMSMSGMMDMMQGMMAPNSGDMGDMPGGSMPEMSLPAPQEMPGLYCSTGKATCGDLDYSKSCICPTCPVYTDNALDNMKYCRKGSAAQIG